MMTRLSLLAVLAIFVACRKSAPAPASTASKDPLQTREIVAGEDMIDFPDAAFACRAPAHWATEEPRREGQPLISFWGPPVGAAKARPVIAVARYPGEGTQNKTPKDYIAGLELLDRKVEGLSVTTINGHRTTRFHSEHEVLFPESDKVRYVAREDVALVEVNGGYFELTHSAPRDGYDRTLPVFEALVRSFKPKG